MLIFTNFGRWLMQLAFPIACYTWPKLRADAGVSLCGVAFTVKLALRCWKHGSMSCSRVNEHSAAIRSETGSAYIYLFKSQPLWFDNGSMAYSDFGIILVILVALVLNKEILLILLFSLNHHLLRLYAAAASALPPWTVELSQWHHVMSSNPVWRRG